MTSRSIYKLLALLFGFGLLLGGMSRIDADHFGSSDYIDDTPDNCGGNCKKWLVTVTLEKAGDSCNDFLIEVVPLPTPVDCWGFKAGSTPTCADPDSYAYSVGGSCGASATVNFYGEDAQGGDHDMALQMYYDGDGDGVIDNDCDKIMDTAQVGFYLSP